jgi:hypothetical protein
MRAAFCSFQQNGGRGGREAKHLSLLTAFAMIAYRRWLLSPYRHGESTWGFMSSFSNATSRQPMCQTFCERSSNRFPDISCSCWTVPQFTKARLLMKSRERTPASTSNDFLATHQNSTQSNKSGTTSKDTWQTACRSTNKTSASTYTPTQDAPDAPKQNSAHSSSPPNYPHYHGNYTLFMRKAIIMVAAIYPSSELKKY